MINPELLKNKPLAPEDKNYLKKVYAKFVDYYTNESLFVAQLYSTSYVRFGLSDTFSHIVRLLELNNICSRVDIAVSFLFHMFDNPGHLIGSHSCVVGIAYFDKEFSNYIEINEDNGQEYCWISKEKYVHNMVEQNRDLADTELARVIRTAFSKTPVPYDGEFASFLARNGLAKCKKIFEHWFQGCFYK